MSQQSFSDMEYSLWRRTTKREVFLDIMDEIIPWDEWVDLIKPHYFSGKRGRPPKGFEKMLRMYLLQCWFKLSHEGVEDAIYDSYAFRKFMGINLLEEQVPDATTLLHFRRTMEESIIGEQLFRAINYVIEQNGYLMRGGTIVDATIINAPNSTKNVEKSRDPEMHQTKKGNEWQFGMKCHAGVDAGSGLVHTIEVTAANVHDINVTAKLIREDDEVVYGDSGYLGIKSERKFRAMYTCPPSPIASTAGRESSRKFRTTPLTGSALLKTANLLHAVRWSIFSTSSRTCSATPRLSIEGYPTI